MLVPVVLPLVNDDPFVVAAAYARPRRQVPKNIPFIPLSELSLGSGFNESPNQHQKKYEPHIIAIKQAKELAKTCKIDLPTVCITIKLSYHRKNPAAIRPIGDSVSNGCPLLHQNLYKKSYFDPNTISLILWLKKQPKIASLTQNSSKYLPKCIYHR